MIIDHRVCRLQPSRAREMKHPGRLVGDVTTEVGNVNEIGHTWAYRDLANRTKRRAVMAAGPAW